MTAKVLLTKSVFIKTIVLLTTFNWVIRPLPNRAERNLEESNEEFVSRIDSNYENNAGKKLWKNVKSGISKLIY